MISMTKSYSKKYFYLSIILIVLISIVSTARTPQALKDKVQSLPGYYNFSADFEMYSGYFKIQQTPQISIHYIFVTSTNKSQTDPVTLWLNGGPGCSSLLGFAQEVGPNMLLSGSKKFSKTKNIYSWNQVSNMLFFESPPGVGYSINEDPSYIFNDSRTAQDGLKALQAFYTRFPEFKPNKFWIAGQSYCGMYIPFLGNEVLTNAKDINFQGMLIGNGAMWLNMNWRRQIGDKFWKSHYYFGPQISKLLDNCRYTDDDESIPSCARGMSMADRAVDTVNPYMTTGICYTPDNFQLEKSSSKRRFSRVPFHTIRNPKLSQVSSGSGSPCTDDEGIQQYFNLDSVKSKLHITKNITWAACNQTVNQNYHMNQTSLGLFETFKAAKLKILLYSGNVDAVVPYVQTEAYIAKLGWRKLTEMAPVKNSRDSLMGWFSQYEGLTYAVVNGAGHMVPGDKPNAAYGLFKDFISGMMGSPAIVQQ